MQIYSNNKYYKLYHGSMLDMLSVIEKESIDSIVTDPPYELNFMNKGWDNSGIAFQKETWQRCFDVLKPGGYLLAFGGSRTFHRIACTIEDAGFEIRDTIMWLYGSGFPKSMNIGLAIDKKLGLQGQRGVGGFNVGGIGEQENGSSKLYIKSNTDGSQKGAYKEYKSELSEKWAGWGTCLKPAYEPIIVARKPCIGSCVDNVMKYGVGGINIDECRVGDEEITTNGGNKFPNLYGDFNECKESTHNGRFPANVILTYDETDFEEVCFGMPNTISGIRNPNGGKILDPEKGWNNNSMIDKTVRGFDDSGSAARYFYCAKASVKDRDEGCDYLEDKKIAQSNQAQAELKRGNELDNGGMNKILTRKNSHPTVKPTSLMQYLVRLVTPNGGTVLDPFNGSGSTGKAAMYEVLENEKDFKYIGIELTKEYLPISEARINFVLDKIGKNETETVEKEYEQMDIFDFLK